MKYYKKIQLKNGITCVIRSANSKDSRAMLAHLKLVSAQTDFLSRTPQEITTTLREEIKFLRNALYSKKNAMLVATINDKLIASSNVFALANTQRQSHIANFGIAIQKDYWGMGIGTQLLESSIEVAKIANYTLLQLDVVSTNTKAINLYKKFGFEIIGTNPMSFKNEDNSYTAQHIMIKPL